MGGTEKHTGRTVKHTQRTEKHTGRTEKPRRTVKHTKRTEKHTEREIFSGSPCCFCFIEQPITPEYMRI